MPGTLRGYCNTCNREYANIYQHKKTKTHQHRVEQLEKEVLEKNNSADEDMPDLGEPGCQVQEDTRQTETEDPEPQEWVKIEDLEEPQEVKEKLFNLGFTEVRTIDGELR